MCCGERSNVFLEAFLERDSNSKKRLSPTDKGFITEGKILKFLINSSFGVCYDVNLLYRNFKSVYACNCMHQKHITKMSVEE